MKRFATAILCVLSIAFGQLAHAQSTITTINGSGRVTESKETTAFSFIVSANEYILSPTRFARSGRVTISGVGVGYNTSVIDKVAVETVEGQYSLGVVFAQVLTNRGTHYLVVHAKKQGRQVLFSYQELKAETYSKYKNSSTMFRASRYYPVVGNGTAAPQLTISRVFIAPNGQ